MLWGSCTLISNGSESPFVIPKSLQYSDSRLMGHQIWRTRITFHPDIGNQSVTRAALSPPDVPFLPRENSGSRFSHDPHQTLQEHREGAK